jgi:hypothetical protein
MGQKFFYSRNNGVIAYVRQDHAVLYGQAMAAGGDPLKLGVKIFTFCDKERLERNPELRRFFTGSMAFAAKLFRHHCTECSSHQSGQYRWDGGVPFSNQEFNDTRCLEYVVTLEDVIEVLGLTY